MRDLTKIFCVTILFWFYLQGCCQTPPKQYDWHQRRINASGMIEHFRSKKAPSLDTEQLVALVGEPDLILSPPELARDLVTLHEDTSYRTKVMSEICTAYCQTEGGRSSSVCDLQCGDGKWKDYSEFKNCILWLYDESKHFKQPFNHDNPWCAQVGFTCEVFFVKDSNVIGSWPITHWEPLYYGEK